MYETLLPYAGAGSVVGGCAAYQGAVDHHLGALAAAMGEPGAAAHLDGGARGVRAAGRPGVGGAGTSGARRARRRRGRLVPARAENVFRRDGAVWQLRYAGRDAHVPDAKGLRDIATLLGLPGQRGPRPGTARAEPARPPGPTTCSTRGRGPSTGAGSPPSTTSWTAADAAGDAERAARAAAERAALVRELAAATGLGGRPRRLADETEKARKTVTARIRHAIGRLADAHPELAEHLAASVQTGTLCSYAPVEPVTWRL